MSNKNNIIPNDPSIQDGDRWLGQDIASRDDKYFSALALANYMSREGDGDPARASFPYRFRRASNDYVPGDGEIIIRNSSAGSVSMSGIAEIIVSNITLGSIDVKDILQLATGDTFKLQGSQSTNQGNYGLFTVTAVQDYAIGDNIHNTATQFTLQYVSGPSNATIVADEYYSLYRERAAGGGSSGGGLTNADRIKLDSISAGANDVEFSSTPSSSSPLAESVSVTDENGNALTFRLGSGGGSSTGEQVIVPDLRIGVNEEVFIDRNAGNRRISATISLPEYVGFTLTALTATETADDVDIDVTTSITGNGGINFSSGNTTITEEKNLDIHVQATYQRDTDNQEIVLTDTFTFKVYQPWYVSGIPGGPGTQQATDPNGDGIVDASGSPVMINTPPSTGVLNSTLTEVDHDVDITSSDHNNIATEFSSTNRYMLIATPNNVDLVDVGVSVGHIAQLPVVELMGGVSTGYRVFCIGDGLATTTPDVPLVFGGLQQNTATALPGARGPIGMQGPAGADGSTTLSGAIDPVITQGEPGDFYLNTATSTLFGPRLSSGWPSSGTSLIGMVGPKGDQGDQGEKGDKGDQGDQGEPGIVLNQANIEEAITNNSEFLNDIGANRQISISGTDFTTLNNPNEINISGGNVSLSPDGGGGVEIAINHIPISDVSGNTVVDTNTFVDLDSLEFGNSTLVLDTEGGTTRKLVITPTSSGGTAPPTAVFNGRITSTVANSVSLAIGDDQVWPLSISHNNGFTYAITGVQVPTDWTSSNQTGTGVDITSPATSVSEEEISGTIRLAGTYTETSTDNIGSFELSITLRSFIPWYAATTDTATVPTTLAGYTSQGSFDSPEQYVVAAVTDDYAQIAIPTHFGSSFRFTVSGFSAAADATDTTTLSGYTVFTFGPLTSTIPTPITITR